ncbi:MAG: bifunctional UDP-N-acetylglucosamine diphosphorylase/glucosamine-1-phosphate N-acetyltransferase GlmU [Alphaproteobacteria bacterium]
MTKRKPLAVVILAAGKGTRMRSDKPKVMHKVLGLPMINWILNTVSCLEPDRIVVVLGKDMEGVASSIAPHQYVVQEKQQGTGDALRSAMPALKGFAGDILVLLGDMPLVSPDSLERLIAARKSDGVTGISVLGAQIDNPFGYGRLLLNSDETLKAIREEKDASEKEKQINIINTGAFCLDSRRIDRWLMNLNNDNAAKEFYITDLPEIAARDNMKTRIAVVGDPREVKGCNTRLELVDLEYTAQQMMRESFIEDGVYMQDPSSVYLHYDTQIGSGTTIEPNVYFGSGVEVGEDVHIRAYSHLEGTKIGNKTTVGPFARLRPGAEIGTEARIGNFVEIKKSYIGNRSKISHLGYIGDTIMGEDVNFSCGAITVNYDGFEKHQTVIGDGVMIGSNVNLVAPVTLDNGAFVAAGSTITKDVPADSLSVGRSQARVRKGWAALYRKRKGGNE